MTDYKNELELSNFMKPYTVMDEYGGDDLVWTGEYNIPNGVEFLAKLEALLSKRELELLRHITVGGRGGTELFVQNVPIDNYKQQVSNRINQLGGRDATKE